MGLTVKGHDQWGLVRVVYGEHVMPASYVAGGDPSDHGLAVLWTAIISGNTDGRKYEYDATNKKILAKHYDYPNAAAGAAIEVPGGTNLSAVTLKVLFVGREKGEPKMVEAYREPGI